MVAALVVGTAPAVAAPNLASLSGGIYGSDGLPVPGASVAVSVLKGQTFSPTANLLTDSTGDVDYTTKAGTYRLDVSAPSADPESKVVVLAKGATLDIEITLQSYGTISGTILDLSTGMPIAGATVEFFLRNPDGTWPATPAASLNATDGTYASGPLLAGAYRVESIAAGYSRAFYDSAELGTPTTVLVNRDDSHVGIDIELAQVAQSGVIEGRVVSGASATPLPSAYVWFYAQNGDGTWPPTSPGWGSPTRTVLTNELGTYTSGELPLGNYKVRFFTIHTSSQWWEYVPSVDLATVVTIDTPGQLIVGIDGWYDKP